ncbi:hypothetical protein [Anaerocolumna xylanovorans]|uniref:Uncharacterized protein n=1 Tax=Anaerocolumna xylanovorans DSM 12503 TaxID=1121345 RepID=A0A1M7YM43_9FIRM|nr:hypothetical protein [Anaerocolumna xylanovorans]SHO53723.1 hypothetical protein SAMN02745217_04258 [Anaerocolumna xylanovorans DSM 12503]
MKLRYKKIIAMVTVCTMGIGMVTFSITREEQNKSTAVERQAKILNASDTEESGNASDDATPKAAVASASIFNTDALTPTPASDTANGDNLFSVESNPLQKNENEEINALITKYLNAKLSGKIEKFEDIVDNTELLDIKDINRKTKYIDKYENIDCYTKKGPEDGSYVVYVYYDLKLSSIDTPAPGMNEYYVKTNNDGKLYIYLGKIDEKTEGFLTKLRASSDVEELIFSVNDKFKTALKTDASLSEFYTKLEDSAKNVSANE